MQPLASLFAAQNARVGSLLLEAGAPKILQELSLEPLRQRNAFLDAMFYNVSILEKDEQVRLASWSAAEGAILSVGPSSAKTLQIWSDVERFLENTQNVSHIALVVAGVGSSALGAAAFARDVANAVGGPVLAVVAGYGLTDLASEAWGGAALFGALNIMRHPCNAFDAVTTQNPLQRLVAQSMAHRSLDVLSLGNLLEKINPLKYLIGHSKGCLVISEALHTLEERNLTCLKNWGEQTHVITISARIGMPEAMQKVTDIIGQFDLLGEANSRRCIPADYVVPGAFHGTNLDSPLPSIPVTKTLQEVLWLCGRPSSVPVGP